MDRRRAAGALLALAACVACSTAAPTASNQTALELLEGPREGCYYNFQHYGEGDRIMTNEPCLNCTCHNKMLMCYLRVCPFTKPIGQDCTIEKRADQCCPIVTCPDVPVDLLTSTSTSYPAEYGATGLGKVDKYGCSIHGKYFPEGSKVPPTPNKPCEHCYCIRNMTTCVMQECTLHVDGCTPIYHKDVCCPVRYSCDHQEDEMLLLDDMTTTVRPTPGFLLTTTTIAPVTQMSQDCVHDDQIFADGALIKTEKACEHCYCMKGDIVCVVQECGTPMENEGKNCTSLPPRQGQCCPDTYICEGDEITSDVTASITNQDVNTSPPPKRVEGSGYRNEPDEPYTEMSTFEGSGEEQATTLEVSDIYTAPKQTPEIIDEVFAATEESLKPSVSTIEPDKGLNTVPDDLKEITPDYHLTDKSTVAQDVNTATQPTVTSEVKETESIESKTTVSDYRYPTEASSFISQEDGLTITSESSPVADIETTRVTETDQEADKEPSTSFDVVQELSTTQTYLEPSSSEGSLLNEQEDKFSTLHPTPTSKGEEIGTSQPTITTTELPDAIKLAQDNIDKQDQDKLDKDNDNIENKETTIANGIESFETTSINPGENEIDEDILPISPPGRIPGEGDCLLNGITYKNNTNVPNTNNCHSSCKCVSSIIKCDPIICSPPPEHMDNMNDCQPIYDTLDACCPTYVCHSRETVPPESHSQMAGTEIPKPSAEKHDASQAHEILPTSSEPCDAGDCQTETEDQVKTCDNGACNEQSETSPAISPPLKHPDGCIGDTCLSSEEICTDGKCQQPTTSEHICNNEDDCRPSQNEPCDGQDCGIGSEVTIPKNEQALCQDSEGCNASDTSELSKPTCEGNSECDSKILRENAHKPECAEESCRKKDQSPDEHKLPSACADPNCLSQEPMKDESADLTTESSIKDQFKESTTETIYDGQKVTQSEVKPTEKLEISTEFSTEKIEHITALDIHEHDTEKPQTGSFDLPVTEKYNEPEITDHETFMPQTHTTKSVYQTTESLEHITQEMHTESPFTTQNEEYPSESPKEDINSSERFTEPPPTSVTTTVVSKLESNILDSNKEHATEISIAEEFTQRHEIPTESPIIFVTSIDPESGTNESEKEYSRKEELFTEVPEIHTTYSDTPGTKVQEPSNVVTQESAKIEPELDGSITEPSVLLHEITTEEQLDNNVKDDVTITTVSEERIPGAVPTVQSIPLEQSSEPQETKLEDTVTNNIYDEIQKEHIVTESPNVFTEKTLHETTANELYITEKESLSPQTTDKESLPDSISTVIENTESSIKDQEYTQASGVHKTVSDEQDTYTTTKEPQKYVTSSIDLETFTTEVKLETETEKNIATERGDINLPQSSTKESATTLKYEDLNMKESTSQYTDTTDKILPEVVTMIADKISSEVPVQLEEQTVSPVFDFNEFSTKISEQTFQEDVTQKYSVAPELQENEIEKHGETSKPLPEQSVSETETTVPPVFSDQELGTKLEPSQEHNEYNDKSTSVPEIFTTKSDDSTSLSEETEHYISELSTIRRVEDDSATTESLKEPDLEPSELPDKTPIISKPVIDDNPIVDITEPSLMEITKEQGDFDRITSIPPGTASSKETVPVKDNKTEEIPLLTTPTTVETDQQSSDKHVTPLPEDNVTENIYNVIKDIDSTENINTSPEYPGLYQTEEQTPPETVTQSQDVETKAVTELESNKEISTTPAYVIKDENKQTESPMSLVTEIGERITSSQSMHSEDDIKDSTVDRTTGGPVVNTPDEEKTISDSHDTEQQKPSTGSLEIIKPEEEHDTKTSPQTYPENENVPVSSYTIIDYTTANVLDDSEVEKTISDTHDTEQQKPSTGYLEIIKPEEEHDTKTSPQTYPENENVPVSSYTIIDYTTANILDDSKVEKTSSPISEDGKFDTSTEFSEKFVPTSKDQEYTTLVEIPTKTGSEVHFEDDVQHKTTIAPPLIESSEESVSTKPQEITTIYPEISAHITSTPYDKESDIKSQPTPVQEDSVEKSSEQSVMNIESTTTDILIKETIEDHTGVTDGNLQQQEHYITVVPLKQEEEHTMLPELLTTKHSETSDNDQEQANEYQQNTQENNTLTPDDHVTTSGQIYTERPLSPEVETYNTVVIDEETFTKKPQDTQYDKTTSLYQDISTIKEESMSDVPELHLSTIDSLPTESSDATFNKEDHKVTLSPGIETGQPEQFITEMPVIPSKEQITTDLKEVTHIQDIVQIGTTTQTSTNESEKEMATLVAEHMTPISQVTEDELLPTNKPYYESELSIVTETVDKHITEAEDITVKPLYTEHSYSEGLETKLPITEENDMSEETTVHYELKIPVVTIPVEIPPEPETESPILKEPHTDKDSDTFIPKETESSVPLQTETSSPQESEPIETETDKSIIKEPIPSVSTEIETPTSVPKENEVSVSIGTGPDIGISKEPETSVPEEVESETSTPKEYQVSVPIETEIDTPIPKEPEFSVPTEIGTETSESKEPESSVPMKTVTHIPIETETSVSRVTETVGIEKETETYAPINTESPVTKVTDTEGSVPKDTEIIVSKTTEASVPQETETINIVPESTTYQPIVEKIPEEIPSTPEVIYSPSETTPYLVELEEHTNKIDNDASSVIPVDTYTKGPEMYQTERGDQSLDTITDKSTQEDFHEKHTTEDTFTLKDEKLSTLPVEEPIDASATTSAHENISHKTEVATQEVLTSTESPVFTPSVTKIGESSVFSEEQKPTINPQVSSGTIEEHDKLTTVDFKIETSTGKKDLSLDTEKVPEQEVAHETTAPEDELIPAIPKTTTTKSFEEITTHTPEVHDKFTKPEEKPAEIYPPTVPDLPKPDVNENLPTEEIPSPDFPPSGSSGYGQEPDYVEEDQAFGPGTCRYGGKVYVSAQQIPRDDPCDFCFCFRSDIICLQQSCPPPIHGCHEEPIQGFCCPRYECPVSMATTLNVTTTTTTTTTTLPPHFLPHAYKGAAQRRGCQIKGHTYKVGDVVRASSGPCLHCTCGGDGQMKCDPKACTPEPMLRQMIAAAVSAKRRR